MAAALGTESAVTTAAATGDEDGDEDGGEGGGEGHRGYKRFPPRITLTPHSRDLLALLSILPDGLSDVELNQSDFPINNIHGCKIALLRTALAYIDDHKRLKVLVPVREYMGRHFPPTDQMMRPLLTHFRQLLELFNTTSREREHPPKQFTEWAS
ncbi:hypothetical protein B0H16DRAFT_1468413 [Mycena metata]|uniref:Uncharacterized protein n=1 Tax=Mycena metata TaxID=1033252 RepID=A0AAD7I0T2_9AGAR|nr:hypothetical protein B0H16DRAFT_1468413 [Mycena metata]